MALIKLTALWINKKDDGTAYLSGKMGDFKILVFRNTNKKEDKHPDYNVYLSPIEKKDEERTVTQEDTPF